MNQKQNSLNVQNAKTLGENINFLMFIIFLF